MSSNNDESIRSAWDAVFQELIAKGEVPENVLYDSDTIIRWWRSLDPPKQDEITSRVRDISQGREVGTIIIECPECGGKNLTTQSPQPGKGYRCGKCGATITFLQTTDTPTETTSFPTKRETGGVLADKTSIESRSATIPKETIGQGSSDILNMDVRKMGQFLKRISKIWVVLAVIIVIGVIISSLPSGDKTDESSSSTTYLNASVVFDGAQFIIANNDNFDWTNIKFEINSGFLSGGYVFRISQMGAGETYTVGAMQFAKEDGERLNPFTHKVQNISIWCDTPKGNLFWFGELE